MPTSTIDCCPITSITMPMVSLAQKSHPFSPIAAGSPFSSVGRTNNVTDKVSETLRERPKKTLNIAHRGASAYRPENTMEAFMEAITLGADSIEMDVRQTVDGHLVLIHDETVERTTDGTGAIAALTIKQVKTLDAGMGTRIPTLEEVFSHFVGDEVILNLEIKTPGIEIKVVEMVHRLYRRDRVLICSFQPSVLRKIKEADPEMKTGFVVGRARPIKSLAWIRGIFPLSTLRKLKADTLHQHVQLAHPYLITRCRRAGVPLYVWVVDEEPEMRRLIRRGIDGISTNLPDVLSKVIQEEDSKVCEMAEMGRTHG
ncbi:MAG: glycerophosphodiester phosphodiesterase [Proteobacteria bacterium]|nr:glycerophosphodiester phosphodiesterase [Pseudomonadota bacterium]